MLSKEPHCHYTATPLAEVICQLRFPEILRIEATLPATFQDRIRDKFPLFQQRQEIPSPKIAGMPGNMSLIKQKPITNYQFSTADGIWRINLTSRFISLSCSRYHSWEDFAAMLDQPLAAFIQVYKPAHFERVGLRYVNFFSRRELQLDDIPFRELFLPVYLGPLSFDSISEASVAKSTIEFDMALQGGCRGKVHAGPGIINRNGIQDKEVKFIFDQDLYMNGPLALNLAVGSLNTLHAQAFGLFRGAITDRMHSAMKPDSN